MLIMCLISHITNNHNILSSTRSGVVFDVWCSKPGASPGLLEVDTTGVVKRLPKVNTSSVEKCCRKMTPQVTKMEYM